jgi:flagellar hook-associated protein 3
MVTRVTNLAQQRTSLANIFRITEELFKAQNAISSGKKIRLPSDDPSGIRTSLGFRTSIAQSKQFVRNIDNNRIFLQSGDSSLQSVGLGMTRAKELAISELGGTSTAVTRSFAATEIDKIIDTVLLAANVKVKNHFLFAGTKTRTQPFTVGASGAVYQGNTENFTVEIARNTLAEVTFPGSEVFATDLNPILNGSGSLADLNGGSGVSAGQFSITDRGGNTATITVTSGMTINSVINAINSSGVNVTAALNNNANGLSLTDTSSVITGSLQISELSGGSTALDLGILGSRDGNLQGSDLNARVTSSTLISQLVGGSGLTLGDIGIVNGAASGPVSLSSASTIGDVLNAINGAGLNVTASINSAGNSLTITSNDPTTVAVVNEIGTGVTAEALGLGGGRNVITTLIQLQGAMAKNDPAAIIALLRNLDTGLESINESRAIIGSVLRHVETTDTVHDQDVVDKTQQLSDLEDSDLVQSASDLAALELALQVTLDTTARVLQPSLLDFLR